MPGTLYQYDQEAGMREPERRLRKDRGEGATLKVNGDPVPMAVDKGFVRLERVWKKGDAIELDLPMPVRRVVAAAAVKEDRGRVAFERGPLVYCAEGVDNGGRALDLEVAGDSSFAARVPARPS